MPGRLKVRLLAARDLPVMDRASDSTDAFVEVRFDGEMFKTDVCKKSLNPQWNSEWFKFEVDDEVLQDEPLDVRVLDYDTYSAHDAIGKVYIDLTPLLTNDSPYVISGWFPIYDTMHGIRGELNVQVKVELFTDVNRFRQTSCEIQFFCTAAVPSGYRLLGVQGFVEELVVNDDPEYQLIDKLRTSRASNEARQRLFSKLSGELQRKVGVKVMEMGGNAVLGYTQNFDLEGESGIVVRAIGTAVNISKVLLTQHSPAGTSPGAFRDSPFVDGEGGLTSESPTPGGRVPASPVRFSSVMAGGSNAVRAPRLSDSDLGSPTAGNIGDSGGGGVSYTQAGGSRSHNRHSNAATANLQNISLLEYPFFTMRSFPPGFIISLGSMVAARSVKLLDKIHNPEEPETRDMWWSEIRTEIRSHARSMNCHAVLGYLEETTICEETIILSASGTAARITLELDPPYQAAPPQPNHRSGSPVTNPAILQFTETSQAGDWEKEKEKRLTVDIGLANRQAQIKFGSPNHEIEETTEKCSLCHIPYHSKSLPFQINLTICAMCKKKKVPDILFTTIDLPKEMPILSHGALIQARVVRQKTKGKGSETSAREVSDSLPFLEYELHTQLLNKLKLRGLNSIFGLRIQICLGETMIAALATGTGVFLGPMPQPPLPRLSTQVQVATQEETIDREKLQTRITDAVQEHRQRLHMQMANHLGNKKVIADNRRTTPKLLKEDSDSSAFGGPADGSDTEDPSDLDVHISNKDTFVLEIDDPKDEILFLVLRDCTPPEGFEMCNTQLPPGINTSQLASHSQMFTQMCQMRYVPHINTNLEFADVFEMLLRRICFKLRRLAPCCLTDLNFHIQIPDEDEVQVAVTGCCLTLGESQLQRQSQYLLPLPSVSTSGRPPPRPAIRGEELMLNLEADADKDKGSMTSKGSRLQPLSVATPPANFRAKTEDKRKYQNIPKLIRGIELTPLPIVIGGTIVKYLGNYNFFLIRESTSVKECGGLGGFMQSFIGEVMAIVRGHVTAIGGNALVGYQMTQCVLFSNLNKNQAQCLINVCGDAVQVNYADVEPLLVPSEPNAAVSDYS